MRALSVRLIAPDGGFWIESASPETHWVETAPSRQQDDHASWRWTVVPQRRGRHRLLLVVTERTVGRDGLAAETAPPDRVIEVTVKGNLGQRAVQWTRLLAAVLLGALIGRFGQRVSWLWLVGVLVMGAVAFLGIADPGESLYLVAIAAEIDENFIPDVELVGDIYHVLSRLAEECRDVPHSGGSSALHDLVMRREAS